MHSGAKRRCITEQRCAVVDWSASPFVVAPPSTNFPPPTPEPAPSVMLARSHLPPSHSIYVFMCHK